MPQDYGAADAAASDQRRRTWKRPDVGQGDSVSPNPGMAEPIKGSDLWKPSVPASQWETPRASPVPVSERDHDDFSY